MSGQLRKLSPWAALEFLDLGEHGQPSCRNHLELLITRRIDELRERGIRAAIARVVPLPYPRTCHCGDPAGYEVR